MGNNSSHESAKVPKPARKETPPDIDRAGRKQQFCRLKRKKPSAKIMLIFPSDKRQQLPKVAGGSGARPGRPGEDAMGAPVGSPAAAPMLRGAGDCADRHEGARAREMKKILVLLLLLDARLQEEGRCAAGAPGGGAKIAPDWQQLCSRLLTVVGADSEADPAEEQERKRRRCPRPRPPRP